MRRGLTPKQERFVEAYCGPAEGNATEAARRAGYANANTQGPRLLVNEGVKQEILRLSARSRKDAILTVDQCKALLSKLAQDPALEPKDQISALDKLLKAGGAYLERREVTHHGAEVKVYLPDNGRDRD
jgi:phage terminase small subunit